MTANDYIQINNSFGKTLIYKWGAEAGFYSELNNLLLAMAYCLEYKIKLVISCPKNSVNCIHKGWEDYFLPFCPIISNDKKIISHLIYKFDYRQPIGLNRVKKIIIKIVKKILKVDYFTSDLWDNFRDYSYISGIHKVGNYTYNDYFDYYYDLLCILYNFNPLLKRDIDDLKKSLNLPLDYVAMHIRGGDKVSEYNLIDYQKYFDLIKTKKVSSSFIFIFTDDYEIYTRCKNQYPEYNFVTSCKETERGYSLNELKCLDKNTLYKEYVKMIASLEVLKEASIIFGTYTTNPGMFLGIYTYNKDRKVCKFLDVEGKAWCVT